MMLTAPFASATRVPLLTLWRKHVVIHADHHRDKDNRVIEQVQLHTREKQLQYAAWDRLVPEVVVSCGLINEQEVLNMVPELDPE